MDKTDNNRALVEQWDGVSWSIVPLPQPPGPALTEFLAVSCPSSSACTAVGSFAFSKRTVIPLREVLLTRWNGERWSAQSAPNPPGHRLQRAYRRVRASNTLCTAVGDWQLNSGVNQTLAEQWDGSGWQIQSTPNPKGPRIGAVLQQVSCPTTELCTAAGSSFEGDAGRPLIERFTAPPASRAHDGCPRIVCRGAVHRSDPGPSNLVGEMVVGRYKDPGSHPAARDSVCRTDCAPTGPPQADRDRAAGSRRLTTAGDAPCTVLGPSMRSSLLAMRLGVRRWAGGGRGAGPQRCRPARSRA